MGEKIIPIYFDYNCCKNCEKRHSGCHADCEEYNTIKDKNDQIKEMIRKEKENEYHSKFAAKKHEKYVRERKNNRYDEY